MNRYVRASSTHTERVAITLPHRPRQSKIWQRGSLAELEYWRISFQGRQVTQATLAEQMSDADILHFHGHVDGQALEQFLVPQPDASWKIPAGQMPPLSQQERYRACHLIMSGAQARHPTSRFTLQDAFAATIRARLVLLMGVRFRPAGGEPKRRRTRTGHGLSSPPGRPRLAARYGP